MENLPQQISSIGSSQNTFQLIYTKRIELLQQKVNKYCSEYDKLMNLLSLGQNFTTILSLQSDIQRISHKVDCFDQKVATLNEAQVQIDKNRWVNQLRLITSSIQDNQSELQEYIQLVKEQKNLITDPNDIQSFQQCLIQNINSFKEKVQNDLAQYSNQIMLIKKTQASNKFIKLQQTVNKKLEDYFNPIHQSLDQIEKEIEIYRLTTPLKDLKKFHQFSFSRLMSEIKSLNCQLEKQFERIQKNTQIELSSVQQKVRRFQENSNEIYYQIKGLSLKYERQFIVYAQLQGPNSKAQSEVLYKTANANIVELQAHIQQVKRRIDLLRKYIHEG